MQVLIFVGESYYPRRHLQDLVGTMTHAPSYDEIALLVQAQTADDTRFDRFSTGQVDWVTALEVQPGKEPRITAWHVAHLESARALHNLGCYRVWEDARGNWHGLRDATDLEAYKVRPL